MKSSFNYKTPFKKRLQHKQYYQRNIKRCRAWARNYRLNHLEKYRAYSRTRARESYKELIAKAKAHPCMDCGGRFEPCQMDFDHRDPATKLGQVCHLRGAKPSRIQEEIAKCDLVCANCHRLRTYKRRIQHAK